MDQYSSVATKVMCEYKSPMSSIHGNESLNKVLESLCDALQNHAKLFQGSNKKGIIKSLDVSKKSATLSRDRILCRDPVAGTGWDLPQFGVSNGVLPLCFRFLTGDRLSG